MWLFIVYPLFRHLISELCSPGFAIMMTSKMWSSLVYTKMHRFCSWDSNGNNSVKHSMQGIEPIQLSIDVVLYIEVILP